MSVSLQDLVKGIDFTGLTGINAGDMNQLVDNSAPASDKGLIVVTSDTAAYVPDVPDAITNTKFQRYIWIRRLHADDASNNKVRIYAWNPTIDADDTYSQWEQIRGVVDVDLLDVQDFPYLANFGLEQASNSRYTVRISVHTIADLKALNTSYITYGVVCYVMGYSETNDGGEGLFVYDSTSTATEDIGLVLAPSSNSGRWLRITNCNERRAEWFGARGDGITDDSAAIQACINSCNRVDLLAKTYIIGTWLMPRTGLIFNGENRQSTVLKLIDNIHTIHAELFTSAESRWYGMLSESAFDGGCVTNDVLIQGILFDANYRGQAVGYKLNNDCIRLRGSGNIVRDCSFTDFASGTAKLENFVVNLGTSPDAVEDIDLRGGKVLHCDFYGIANNSSVFSAGGYVPEITLIGIGGRWQPDDLSVNGTPAGIWTKGIEVAHCRFINLHRDCNTQYQDIHCITTSSTDGVNIHDNYAINVDGSIYYEDSWHNKNITIKNNTFLNVKCGIHFNCNGVYTVGNANYIHRVFGATIENNTIVSKTPTAHFLYAEIAACLFLFSSDVGHVNYMDFIVQNNNFQGLITEIPNQPSIAYNTGFTYIVRASDTSTNYVTYHGVKYYNGDSFNAVSGDTVIAITGDATVSKYRGAAGIRIHTNIGSIKRMTIQDNLIDSAYVEKGMFAYSIGNYKTFYNIYYIGGYNALAADPTCILFGRNKTLSGELNRCALTTTYVQNIPVESLYLDANGMIRWDIPYYSSPKSRGDLVYVKDFGAYITSSDYYIRGRALYHATETPRYVPTGQLQVGLTYIVEADVAEGNGIIYNGTTYTNTQTFIVLAGKTDYTVVGKAHVYLCPMDCCVPISYPRNYLIEDVSGTRSGLHGTLTSIFTLNGYTNLKKGLEGIVKLNFSNENADKIVYFPEPSTYIGRTFKLCLTVPATTAVRNIKLLPATTAAVWFVINNTQTVANNVPVGTTSTTLTKAVMLDVISDGVYWYITY